MEQMNLKQTDVAGIDPDKIPKNTAHDHNFEPIASCEQIIQFWSDSPVIKLDQKKACYIPSLDEVHMPGARTFFQDEEYYSTIFQELCYSTGHCKLLNRHERFSSLNFASNDYSQEEFVAEMGAAYLCGICGIENATFDNSAAYIQGWLKKLKSDKKFIIIAFGLAQKAVDYILDHQDSNLSGVSSPKLCFVWKIILLADTSTALLRGSSFLKIQSDLS